MLRVLITGASGFIGRHLVAKFRDAGHQVVAVDKNAAEGVVGCDVARLAAIREFLAGPFDTIVHAAARTDLRGKTLSSYADNWESIRALATAFRDSSPHLILFSTRLVFAIDHKPAHDWDYAPNLPYGTSKVLAEQLTRDYRGTWTILRPTSIWGPYFETPYRDFFDEIYRGRYMHPMGRSIWKSFGYVENAATWTERVASDRGDSTNHEVFWLTDPAPIEVGEWASQISRRLGVRRPLRVPVPLLRSVATVGTVVERATSRGVPLDRFRLNNLLTDVVYDPERTVDLLGPPAVDPETALDRTVDWYLRFRSA